ncbi:precorrin-6y C5,15-methyltransferase (decarboxylating) subunit CbiE [Devosia rhodophyticola]|uniref:Precorrin-6y C5,15-methyltransferase (Decarboxylating) subunit CbiE n=1 Tax=Devosia rhodophyticola TaxID=3026423 RepID=A0ABY7Z0B7_9HYPH|nr:precorrin-6y C5,15-methyltransferase (decarboxylating) subunit CbiE [Devosia rhodophyticola]WDR06594.1 precorrin-6y C5,15-methyltransferase (decarboxylating) subunit CbiE [Devosia rhodophyticola]
MSKWLDIVGVGEHGLANLPPGVQAIVAAADTIIGPPRFADGDPRHVPWQSPLSAMLDQIDAQRGKPTLILATGDPMWFGIGATLAKRYGRDEIAIHTHPSAFQLAAARLLWPLQHVATISLHGRPSEIIHAHIQPGNRILALTSDRSTANSVAEILVDRGYGASLMTALENLGAANERISHADAEHFEAATIGDFYVLAIDCVASDGAALLPSVPGLPDQAFVSDGQLTKREVRAASLAKLAPFPCAMLWDVGAGCGSIAIEWLRSARDCQAIAFEKSATRLQLIATNAEALGTPQLRIESGDALSNLNGKPMPDAIFLGGDVGNRALFDGCWEALRPGGRLLANAVTVEGEVALFERQLSLGGDIVRIETAVLDQIGRHRVLRPRMAVTQYLVTKP